jgi:hypothetical protein
MTKVLDTLLLPLFSLKHTHLYMIIHITTFHISTSRYLRLGDYLEDRKYNRVQFSRGQELKLITFHPNIFSDYKHTVHSTYYTSKIYPLSY